MLLSPADFDAYSRATGRPVPEEPEERARLVPEITEFRRNQLKSPETQRSEGSGLLQALGIGAAVLGGGALLARGLGRRGGVRMGNAQQAAKEAVQEVNVQDFGNVYRAAGRPAPSRPAPTPSRPAAAPAPTPRPTGSRQGGIQFADLGQIEGIQPKGLLRGREPGGEITQVGRSGGLADLGITEASVVDVTAPAGQQALGSSKDFIAGYFKQSRTPAGYLTEARAEQSPIAAVETVIPESLVTKQQTIAGRVVDQTANAVDAAEDQMTGRVKAQLQRNEDLDISQIDLLEEMAERDRQWMMEQDEPINQVAAQLPDGLPVDQAEGKKKLHFDPRTGQPFVVKNLPRAQTEDQLINEARQYLLSKEIDLDFDYSKENQIQASQVQDRIQKAQYLQDQANKILAEIKAENQTTSQQISPQEFAARFNKQYREELNPELKDVDNARQRAELKAAESGPIGEDIESLLQGEAGEIDVTMRGKALRGGKPNITGDIVYQDDAGNFVSANTGLKTRQAQGPEFKPKAYLLNTLRTASDEDLTALVAQGQQPSIRQTIKNRILEQVSNFADPRQLQLPLNVVNPNQIPGTRIDSDITRLASEILRTRALNNLEPTPLQLNALDRARASVAASQQVLQGGRNQRPTIASGPAQDVARSMETLRRGMVVDPSEPLPEFPSVNQLRTGYATDEDLGPILGASDVYTGAAAEAAGPVIFTGKSKANSVIRGPRITGSVTTPVGRYLTQDNPDVLGTVYKVAGTPANRAISSQVEANAQSFLNDAIANGLLLKNIKNAEQFVTPQRTQINQLEILEPNYTPLQGPSISPLRYAGTLGLPGQEASQRTHYAQYQPGRSVPGRQSPFIGEMTGGTVVVAPPSNVSPVTRRDIGAAPGSRLDLTRRGEKARYFSDYPQENFVTGLEPAPIGPLTQSPGLSRIGGMQQQLIQGAGGVQIVQLTPQGQRIAYPHMDKPVTVPGFRGSEVTNIPKYGIDPGADWRDDLMRSAFRRGGPIRTYQA